MMFRGVISTFSWGGGKFFLFFNATGLLKNWKKKQHFICSNLTLFIVPFFLSFLFSFFLFFLFFFLFSSFLFRGGGGATAAPAPPNDASDDALFGFDFMLHQPMPSSFSHF